MIDPQTIRFLELMSQPKYALLFFMLTAWTLVWKGIALWKSAQNNQKKWFIAILIFNTFGILEIIYVFYFNKQKNNHSIE